MSRSSKKVPFVAPELMRRIEAMNAENKKEVVKTWSRASTIYPQMVGHTIAVVVKEGFVNGDGGQVVAQIIVVFLQQSGGQTVEANGRLHFIKPQLIVQGGVLIIKGNGKGRMITDAEGHLVLVQILDR